MRQLTMLLFASILSALLLVIPSEQSILQNTVNKQNSPPSVKDIEDFVKQLEYETLNGLDNSLTLVPVDLNLLDSELLADDVLNGLQEEFASSDAEIGGTKTESGNKNNQTHQIRKEQLLRARQLSLIYQGVYAPDARFNAFVDGVMVNMVADMKRKRMDPLYFRVYDRGIIEHVSTRRSRNNDQQGEEQQSESNSRTARQSGSNGSAIGGGVIRGLTSIKRFGNAEVQLAGNVTLVRGHWLAGPLDLIIDYRGSVGGITRVRTALQAIQIDTLTNIDRYGAEMAEFQLISPLFDYMPYYGNRTLAQQHTTELVVRHLFSNASFMTLLLRDSFEIASYDKIIPQFGAEANYYSVLKYLFSQQNAGGRENREELGRETIEQVEEAIRAATLH